MTSLGSENKTFGGSSLSCMLAHADTIFEKHSLLMYRTRDKVRQHVLLCFQMAIVLINVIVRF